MENKVLFSIYEIIIDDLVLSASLEYICYGSTAIINILILSARGSFFTSESAIYGLQILTFKVTNFHSLEVVDRVSETQLQVGEIPRIENKDIAGLLFVM